MRPLIPVLVIGALAVPRLALAQMSSMPSGGNVHEHGEMEMHPMTGVLGIPLARDGSGTAWLPDDSPMRALHRMAGDWSLMLHWNVFAGYDYQGSDAGDGRVTSQNWVMGMASHPLAGGIVTGRSMLSLEPLTVGNAGYPLLLQTGEGLVDRQHPHDLFMEVASIYERPIAGPVALQLYGALAGEPALGPVAFPHRPSAMFDPLATLGHHWQDSTHISFGVVTAGVFTRVAKLEGSWFNGREPDDDRYDLDLRRFDSYSTRLSINPSHAWSLQGSYGYLASPEESEPDVSVQRVTASAIHAMPIGEHGSWTSTVTWGRNMPSNGPATNSALAETAVDLSHLGTTFGRVEYVVKTGHDFELPAMMTDVTLPLGEVSLGHVHPVARVGDAEAAIGVLGSIAVVDDQLVDRYGTRTPLGVMAYVQLMPAAM
jgi:hypothetical protein